MSNNKKLPVPHVVELDELIKWMNEEEVIFASSTRERKRLSCSLRGGFKVTIAGRTVWQGMQPFAAVEAYNNIIEKHLEEKPNFIL